MDHADWLASINRITPHQPTNLDHILQPHDPRAKTPGRAVASAEVAHSAIPDYGRDDIGYIGFRLREAPENPADMAMRLAALAIEKAAQPILLSYVEYTGLEPFGFRVERITGETEEEQLAWEAQIRALWGIEIIL